jgi:NADH:ubiquinone oxidoreductase subunit E
MSSPNGKDGDERKKRPRTAFTATQIKALEAEFERNKYLSVSKRLHLSRTLHLTETQVSTFCLLYTIFLYSLSTKKKLDIC